MALNTKRVGRKRGDYPNNTNESLAVLPLVHDRLPHPVDVLGALPLALLQTDVADDLGPASVQAQLLEVLPQLLLLLAVLPRPLPFLLLLLVPNCSSCALPSSLRFFLFSHS